MQRRHCIGKYYLKRKKKDWVAFNKHLLNVYEWIGCFNLFRNFNASIYICCIYKIIIGFSTWLCALVLHVLPGGRNHKSPKFYFLYSKRVPKTIIVNKDYQHRVHDSSVYNSSSIFLWALQLNLRIRIHNCLIQILNIFQWVILTQCTIQWKK